jgi:uncharacterized protein
MKEFGKILAYAAAVIFLGCILAPPLYHLGRWAATQGLMPSLAEYPFPRFFDRAILVAAVALLWPFLRSLGIRRWTDLGLAPNPARWRHLGAGLLCGVGGLAIVGVAAVAYGNVALRPHFNWAGVGNALLTAATVALIEETFFRGVLLGVLRRRWRWLWALAFLSLLFAWLHFLRRPDEYQVAEVQWRSGFDLLPHLLWQFGEPRRVVGGFLTLLLVGVTLGYCAIATRSLFLSLGLHAGWVAALKSFSKLTSRQGSPNLWFGTELLEGLAPVLLILLTLLLLVVALRRFGYVPADLDGEVA